MLQQLREKTKTIIWIAVVAFVISIFAYWGMNLKGPQGRKQDRQVIGRVDGEDVPRQLYSSTFNELLQQVQMQKGADYRMSESEQRMLVEQAWERTIQKMLVAREIKRRGIVVTDNELVAFLRRNPPPAVQQAFVNEQGQFDYQAYLAALGDPARDWRQLEQWAREQIPEIKLQNALAAQIHIPEYEVLERFKKETIKVKAAYVTVPFVEEDPSFEPTEEAIAALYDEVKNDYIEFEKRRVEMIKIDISPTEADERDIRERLMEIRAEILAGDDFAEAAKSYSDDYMSAENGGDLGEITRGIMVPEFDDAAFALEIGDISMPVRTDYGYHLIQVQERRIENDEEKIRVRHILMEIDLGYETVDSLRAVLDEVSETITNEGFERGAELHGYEILSPPPFARGSFIQDLGYMPRIINFAFNHRVGDISSAIEEEKAVYFVKILEKIDEFPKPLEEIREQLVARLRRERTDELTHDAAEAIRQKALTSGDLEAAAHARELEIRETPLFLETETVPAIGVNTAFAHACHELPVGELSAPIKGRNGFYLIRVTERTEPDMTEYEARRTEILNQLRSEMGSHFVAGWYDEILQSAEVIDLREGTLF